MKKQSINILTITAVLLSACGGGGSSIIEDGSGNNNNTGTSYRLAFTESDIDNDGVITTTAGISEDGRSTFAYDSNGNLLSILSETFGADVGDIDGRVDYTYDSNNKVIKEETSSGFVGSGFAFSPYVVFDYSYGSNGKLSGIQHKRADESTASVTPAFVYDTNDNLMEAILPRDFNNSFVVKKVTYSYDSSNTITTKNTDYFIDGSIDRIQTYSYTNNELSSDNIDDYNSSGSLISSNQISYSFIGGNLDTVVNGTVTKTYYYDLNGNLDYIDLVDSGTNGISYKTFYTWVAAPCNPLSHTLPEPTDKPSICTIQ